MKTIIAIVMVILLMFPVTSNTKWITTVNPLSSGEVTFHGKSVTKTISVEAKSVKVSMYLEAGFGWHEFELPGKREVLLQFHQMIYVPPPDPEGPKVVSANTQHRDYSLRLCAIAAPQWVCSHEDPGQRLSLNSRTPFSLQNAMRCLAQKARQGELACNWEDSRLLNESILLLDDYEDNVQLLQERLKVIRPNVLFIGLMTLSFPGAIRIAQTAKQMLGDEVLVVLGGRHVNETFYMAGNIPIQHKASPLKLMQNGRIDHVFDLVVSGDGEYVTLRIAEVVGLLLREGLRPNSILTHIDKISSASGTWCLGWIDKSNEIKTITGSKPIDRDQLPIPAEVFGVDSKFPIFGTDYTAHVCSDSGRGCVRDCNFCSERRLVAGTIEQPSTGADRLFRQLCIARQIGEDNGCSMSAFAEDSILLTGNPQQLSRLADLMERTGFYMKFGGQFTIADLINPRVQSEIVRLQKHGLCYIYTGMETIDQQVAAAFSKNRAKETPWLVQNEKALAFIRETSLSFGVSVLFGLGESHAERILHLDMLTSWKEKYGNPRVVSLNWATEHPLFDRSKHDFVEWGTDKDDPRLGLMQKIFGEASARYCFNPLPDLDELRPIAGKFETLNPRV